MQQFTGTEPGNKSSKTFMQFPLILKWIFIISVFFVGALASNNANAQFSNVPVTGFNADVVAEGTTNVDASATTTDPVDGSGAGANFVFVTSTFKPSGVVGAACSSAAFPSTITSTNTTTNTGITYNFQSPTGANSLRVPSATPLDLSLVSPTSASTLYVVCLGGNGAANFTAKINFSDLSSETVSSQAPDWCAASPSTNKLPNATSPTQFYRIPRTSATCGGALCQYMYEIPLVISPANYTKTITSITFTNTAAATVFLHILAVGKKAICIAPPDAATALTQGATTTSSIAGSFTAAASTPSGYLVVAYPSGATPVSPTFGINYSTGQLLGGGKVIQSGAATSFSAAGLSGGTTYDIYVYSFNTAANCGGPAYNTTSVLSASLTTSACAGVPGGTYPIGPTAGPSGYGTITAALAAISAGITGPVILELQPDYTSGTETFPILFSSNPCIGGTNNLTIRPAATATNLSITSSNAPGTINLNGATNVTFDGRPGGLGTSSQLTISNTNAGASYAVQFINEASSNTFTYCNIQSRNTSTGSGTIVFSTTTGIAGNDNNNITQCNIGDNAGFPFLNAIYASGSTGTTQQYNDNNTISNNNIFNFFSAGSATNGILVNGGNSGWSITGNSFYQTANRTYTSANTHAAINISSTTAGVGFAVSNNFIGGTSAGAAGTAYTMLGTVATLFRGIVIGTAATAASGVQNNTITNIALTTSSGSAILPGIFSGIHITAGLVNVGTTAGNTIGAPTGNGAVTVTSTTSGSITTGIYGNSGAILTIQNNNIGAISTNSVAGIGHIIQCINIAGAGNHVVSLNNIGSVSTANSISSGTSGTTTATCEAYGILAPATSTSLTISSNFVRNISALTTGSTTIAGIYASGTQATLALNNNTISDLKSTGANGNIYGIRAATSVHTISANIISSLSYTANSGGTASFVYGIYNFGSPSSETITNNQVFNLSMAGTSTSTGNILAGIYTNTASGVKSWSLNQISDINFANSSTGSATLYGIFTALSTPAIFKNKIYNLTATNGAASVTYGIFVSSTSSSTATIYNNIVGSLNASASNLAAPTPSVAGLYISTGTTVNAYYNTIHLSSSSSGTNFGTAAVYATSSPTTIDLRNNIFSNVSTPNGTGKTVAYQRSSTTLTNYAATSNNNLYYAGSATTNNLLFYDGTNALQAISALKAFMATRDGLSVSENVSFLSTTGSSSNFLHINPAIATQTESAAAPVATITDDFDGDARNAGTPDIGADEFAGIISDQTPPSITAVTITGSACSLISRSVTALISDASGVDNAGFKPRIWFRKNAGTYFSTEGSLSSGTVNAGTWTFNIDYSLLGGVTAANTINYFVVAQDVPANVTGNPLTGLVLTDVNTVTTPPTTALSYTVLNTLSGTYSVGTGQTYSTISNAIADYNAACLAGPVVFALTDASYAEATAITINSNAQASAINTLTIKPTLANTNIAVTGGSSSAIFILNGADYVTLDGSIAATANTVCPLSVASRNLTITNTSTSTGSAVVWLQTTTGADAATNNNIINCNLAGSGVAQTLFGAGSGSATIGTSSLGAANNNNSFINNNISGTQYGIYSQGASAANKNTGTIINQNLVNTSAGMKGGIWAGFENNITISGNNISNISQTASPDVFGITCGFGPNMSATTTAGNEVTNASITKNIVGSVVNTGAFSAYGIGVSATTAGTTLIANNMVSGVAANGTGGDFSAGIVIGGGAGSITNIYYNTVAMQGTIGGATSATQTSACLALTNSTAPTLDIRNNIFSNRQLGNAGASLRFTTIAFAYSTFTNLTSNNNDLYAAGAGPGTYTTGITGTVVGGTNSVTLANWQATTGKDAASKSVVPLFVSATDLHLTNLNSDLDNAAAVISVSDDIDCTTRNASTPDIGADEFTSVPTVLINSVAASPLGNQCVATARTITANVTAGAFNITSVTLNYSFNGAAQTPIVMTGGNAGAGQTSDWTATIPAATPVNAAVTWSVTAVDAAPISRTTNGTGYTDAPLTGVTATAVAAPGTICSGTATVLTASLAKFSNGTIGTGTSQTSATSQPTAFCNRWPSYRMQLLYTAAELSAAGLGAGNINSMSWNITTPGDAVTNSGFTVQIGATSLTALSAFIATSGFTTVYPTQTYIHSGSGIQTIPFTTAFAWDGISNIVVDVVMNGANATNNSITYYTATAGNTIAYTSTASSNSASLSTNRLNTTFSGNAAPAITTVSWSDGTNIVGTANPQTVNPTNLTAGPVTVNYVATITAGGCTTTASTSVNVVPLPNPPNANNSTQCGIKVPDAFVTTGGSNGTYKWYDAQSGGTLLQTGGTTFAGQISVTTHFWVAESNGTCESARTDLLAAVAPADAVQALVDNSNPCMNSSITLSVTQTPVNPLTPNNYSFSWTASPVAGSGLPSSVAGNTLNITPTAAGTYTYTVQASDGAALCTNNSTVVVTVKALPVIAAATATPPAICAGLSSTLYAAAGVQQFVNIPVTGFNHDVVANGVGNPSASTSATFDNGEFVLAASDWNYTGSCTALTNFMPVSGQVTANASVVGGALTYILKPYNSNNDLRVPATGSGIGSGTLTLSTPVSATKLFLLYSVGNGPITSGITVTVNFADASTQVFSGLSGQDWFGTTTPAIENIGRVQRTLTTGCVVTSTGGPRLFDLPLTLSAGNVNKLIQSITVATTNGAATMNVMAVGGLVPVTYNWTWNPGSLSGSSVIVTPSITTTYTATATDPTTSCSNTSTVTVTVNQLPPFPSGNNGTDQCGTAITDASVSSNNATDPQVPAFFKWYSLAAGGTLLQSGTSTTYTTPISETTDFYVSEVSANGCEGPRVHFSTVVSEADLITVNASTLNVCSNTSTDISASYTPTFNSYATYTLSAAPLSGSGLEADVPLNPNGNGDGSDPYTVTPTANGTYTFTITANDPDKGCTAVGTVVITVNPNPVIDSIRANPSTVCAGVQSSLSVYSGSLATGSQTLPVYTSPGSSSSSSGDYLTLVNFQSINNVTTTGGANGFVDYTSISAPTINSGGSYPITVNVSNGGTEYAGVWFDWNRNGVYDAAEFTNIPLTASGTYNGTVNIIVPNNAVAGVVGMRVRAKYNAALGSGDAYASYTYGETEEYKVNVIGVVTQNPTYSYSWAAPGPVTVGSTPTISVSPSATTTYTATVTGAGCSATATVTLTVNPLPAAPVAPASSRCGPGSVTLTATGGSGVLHWYSVASGGTSLQTGGSFTTNVTVDTDFWVAETSAFACEGPRTQVHVTVTTPPTLAITAGGPTTFCQGAGVTLNGATASDPAYTQFTWSISPALGGGLSGTTGAAVSVTPTAAGTYTITLSANDGIPSGCANITNIVVTMNPNPLVGSVTANPTSVCSGGTVTLTGQPQYLSVPVSGYNVDAVANGVGPVASSTTGDLDNLYTLAASDWNFNGSCTPLSFFVPNSGTVAANSTVANGLVYNLQPYTGLNCLRIPATGTGTTGNGTFTVTTPTNMSTIYLLYGAGNGPITNGITVTVTFTDATTQVFSNLTATDWFSTSNPAISNLGRVTRLPATPGCATTVTSGPQLFDMSLALSASNYAKLVQSIKIDKTITTGIMNIFGVGMQTPPQAGIVNWSWNPGNLSGNTVTVNPTSTTTYTATATNQATSCSSSNTVTVTIAPVTANATATPSTPVCAGASVALSANATGTGPFIYAWTSTPAGTYPATAGINVTPAVTTTYTIAVTDACSNTVLSSVTVTVNPLPTASIAETGPITLCSPASQVLTATTDAASPAYQWTLNGANIPSATGATYTVSGVSTGTYRVIVTNILTNCVSAASAPVSVTINAQPASVTVTPLTATICNGSSQSLSASGGTTGGAGNATIGTGTTLTSTTTQPTAFCNRWPSSRMQTLFTASELAAAGLSAGSNINSMAFTITSNGDGTTNSAFTVKIAPSALTVLSGDFVSTASGFTTVYPSATYTHAVGVNVIPFSTPFLWNGTSNIIVEVMHNGADAINNSETRYTATGTNMVAYTTTSAANAASFSTQRLNVIFGYSSLQTPTWSWSPAGSLNTPVGATVIASPSATTTYTATATNSFGCTNSNTATVNVNPRPTATISGSAAYCQGANTSTNLTITFTGTAPWNYTYTDGTTPVSGTTSTNPLTVTVAPNNATPGVTTYTLTALSDALCASIPADLTGSGTVTVNPSAATPTASVVQPTCAVATGTINVTSPLGAGNTYSLDGVTFQSGTSFPGKAPGTYTLYVNNSFGCFAPATVNVTVDPQPFIPAAPTVTGIVNVCPYIAPTGGAPITFHASSPGATSYSWTIPPARVIIVSGQGTADLTVRFDTGYINVPNKQFRVKATSVCGTSALTVFYTLAQYPATPNPITGPSDACPYIGTATTVTYTTNKALSATGYIWTLPAGVTATHPNPAGENDTTIVVTFTSGFTVAGNITVNATNDCGTSGARNIFVSRNPPPQPGLITGPVNACEFSAPNGTPATYSVVGTPGVIYTWTPPAGYTNLTGQGTNSISFIYPNGFTTGTLSVIATSGCGTSVPRNLSIYRYNPAVPGVIDVIQTHFCGEGVNSREFTYQVSSMPAQAVSVQWTVPASATLVSGQGTTMITVSYPDAAVSGYVTAQGVSNCASGTVRSTTIKLPACPPPDFTGNNNGGITNPLVKGVNTSKGSTTPSSELMEVKIFPNPTVSDFKLQVITSQSEVINVRVFDNEGRLFKTFKLMPNQTIALGAELKAGSYMVEVRQGKSVKTTKVIKF